MTTTLPLYPRPMAPVTVRPLGDNVIAPRTGLELERRGRTWLVWSFLFCPCHLPLSLAVLGAVFAGTSIGAVLRDHAWIAGTLITATWLVGTAYGFRLIRRAQRSGGACPTIRSS